MFEISTYMLGEIAQEITNPIRGNSKHVVEDWCINWVFEKSWDVKLCKDCIHNKDMKLIPIDDIDLPF